MDPLTAGLIGCLVGLGVSPLFYVAFTALYSTAEAVNQDVENSE